jgi:uncharacterized protein YigE (DUF2233 family)
MSRCLAILVIFLGMACQPQSTPPSSSHVASSAPSSASLFRIIQDGLAYGDLSLGENAYAHVFRIDLQRWRPTLMDARSLGRSLASVSELAKYAKISLAVNGSFFDANDKPLGLLVSEKVVKNPLRKNVDWGVFFIRDNQATLLHSKKYTAEQTPDFAIQCGPRIVIDGEVPKLKPQSAWRTALAITSDGSLLVLASYGSPVYASYLGQFLRDRLDVKQALLLDGGPSTQIYANIGSLQIDQGGISPVAVAVGFVPQE